MRALLAGLLALACGGALADWTAVGAANEIYAAYADSASIRRSGGMATMVGLYDFPRQDFTPEGHGLYSTVVLREYDCVARRVRLLSSVDFSGHMGAGTPVSTSSMPRRWEAVVAGGINEAYWGVACGGAKVR
ncbi:MAG: surface-adhesin E family protein [Burkholderiales bacterium]